MRSNQSSPADSLRGVGLNIVADPFPEELERRYRAEIDRVV